MCLSVLHMDKSDTFQFAGYIDVYDMSHMLCESLNMAVTVPDG